MIDLKEYSRLKEMVESHQRKADRSIGALEQLKQQLKKEFKCNSLEEAKSLLTDLAVQEQEQEKEYKEELTKFKKEYGDRLEGK